MDIMNIKTKFAKGIANRIAKKTVKDKIGIDADFRFDTIDITHNEGRSTVNINLSIDLNDSEISKLLRNFGF